MYDELVKRLKNCATQAAPCETCGLIEDGSCSDTLMKQAADAIEELICEVADEHNARLDAENRLRWIPVHERMPEEAGKYLVCGRWRGKPTEIWVCEFMTLGCLKGWTNNAANPVVSHWMPLPKGPVEE